MAHLNALLQGDADVAPLLPLSPDSVLDAAAGSLLLAKFLVAVDPEAIDTRALNTFVLESIFDMPAHAIERLRRALKAGAQHRAGNRRQFASAQPAQRFEGAVRRIGMEGERAIDRRDLARDPLAIDQCMFG